MVAQEGEGALEEVHRSRGVLAIQGTPACRFESISGPLAERTQPVIDRSQLRPVAVGLFEVISEYLILVDAQAVRTALEPARDALMELSPPPLGERTVRSLLDEDDAGSGMPARTEPARRPLR